MNDEKSGSAKTLLSRDEAFLAAAHFLSAWEEWIKSWKGSVQVAREPGSADYPPFVYRMVGGALSDAHFGCRFLIWPMGRLGTGYADAELIVMSCTDGDVVTFAHEGATNSWTKTGNGLRGFSCTWPETRHPEFPLPTTGAWLNVLAHQTWCVCGALLTPNCSFVCPNPNAPIHQKKAASPASEAHPTNPSSYRQRFRRVLVALAERL